MPLHIHVDLPFTGIVCCCAAAASGQITAPPSRQMNPRQSCLRGSVGD
jgi:hypothetical protein